MFIKTAYLAQSIIAINIISAYATIEDAILLKAHIFCIVVYFE